MERMLNICRIGGNKGGKVMEEDEVRNVRKKGVVIIIIGFISICLSLLWGIWFSKPSNEILGGILAIIAFVMFLGGGITTLFGFIRLMDAEEIVRLNL